MGKWSKESYLGIMVLAVMVVSASLAYGAELFENLDMFDNTIHNISHTDTDSLTVSGLASCDTIDTNTAGNLSCGTDFDSNATTECSGDQVLLGNSSCLDSGDLILAESDPIWQSNWSGYNKTEWDDAFKFTTNDTFLENLTHALFSILYSHDWSNVSITESQINDLKDYIEDAGDAMEGTLTTQNITIGSGYALDQDGLLILDAGIIWQSNADDLYLAFLSGHNLIVAADGATIWQMDSAGAVTHSGTLDMNGEIITNIGDSGTDFDADGGLVASSINASNMNVSQNITATYICVGFDCTHYIHNNGTHINIV